MLNLFMAMGDAPQVEGPPCWRCVGLGILIALVMMAFVIAWLARRY
jgi:hypothetical protein